MSDPRTVIVTGDTTVDCNIAVAASGQAGGWRMDQTCRVFPRAGGAALLVDLIGELTHPLPPEAGPWTLRRALPALARSSYSLWSLFEYANGQRGEKPAWRLRQHLGLDPGMVPFTADAVGTSDGVDTDDVVVIADDALGFRNNRDGWPAALREERRPGWIVWKTSASRLPWAMKTLHSWTSRCRIRPRQDLRNLLRVFGPFWRASCRMICPR
ncbi:MAG: hypothetical protein ACRENP_11195 [Longimicrobiales bacterium]